MHGTWIIKKFAVAQLASYLQLQTHEAVQELQYTLETWLDL